MAEKPTNVMRVECVEGETCPRVADQNEIAEKCRPYLGDESKLSAEWVTAVYFPENLGQLTTALASVNASGGKCVFSGGRTGIAGGAVPNNGDGVISLDRMRGVVDFREDGGEYRISVQAGVSLARLSEGLRRRDIPIPRENAAALKAWEKYRQSAFQLWLPVDPTETSASFGGLAACNASGARTLRYGQIGKWVKGLTVATADGGVLRLERGAVKADNFEFVFIGLDGVSKKIKLPELPVRVKKHTLGYQSAPDLDAVDLFVGSEGTLGAIAEITLALAPVPRSMAGVLAVFSEEAGALRFVMAARKRNWPLSALEYFDQDSLRLLKKRREMDGPGSKIPDIPSWEGAALYLEFAADSSGAVDLALADLERPLLENGSSLEKSWAAFGLDEIDRQKEFRHAVPEGINALIAKRKLACPGLHKVGTDMAVPEDCLERVVALYRDGLNRLGLESAVFGHIGDSHLHVNILPRNPDDLAKAKELYREWAKAVAAMGGAVAAEHGIGRLKRNFLTIQFDASVLASFRAIRHAFDPKGTLSPEVLV